MKGRKRHTKKRSQRKRKCFFYKIKKTRKQRGGGGVVSETNILSIPGHPLISKKQLNELDDDPEFSDVRA